MRRVTVAAVVAFVVSLTVGASAASAFVLSNGGNDYGVAYVPGTHAVGPPGGSCSDPWLPSDLHGTSLPNDALCWHGGGVMHGNETFAITWDAATVAPYHRYWQTTGNYMEQFLRDVADGAGTLSSPYGVTPQYQDGGGRAGNSSLWGGGCIDYGSVGGASCRFPNGTASGSGIDYPTTGNCPVTGTNQFHEFPDGGFGPAPNDICLTDSQVRTELAATVGNMGLAGRVQPGHAPLLVVLMPQGVDVCLDAVGALCSANSGAGALFCSYHSHINVGGTDYAYVVQPWTASWTINTGCDEPVQPEWSQNVSAQQLAVGVGQRLVSPLSQGQIASIANPDLNGWYANNGTEINDNGCVPFPKDLDKVTVGNSAQNPYWLQREFNNAGAIASDPNVMRCTPSTPLVPGFVVPSPINAGDVVAFDGSVTVSALLVPAAGYHWSFGDGKSGVGPSIVHTYAKGGNFTVTLTVTDRGSNVRSLSQTVNVLGPNGQVIAPQGSGAGLHASLQLLPEGLRSLLRKGVAMRVTSSESADGIAKLMISRGAARRAHIKLGRGQAVVIGRGTIAGIKNGSVVLHVQVSPSIAKKLRHLRHLTLTVRLHLVGSDHGRVTIDAAGRY